MYMCLVLFWTVHLDPYLSTVIVVPLMFVLGWVLYRWIFKPVLSAHFVMVLQLTLGLVFVLENSFLIFFKANPITVPSFISFQRLTFGPFSLITPMIVSFVVAIAVSFSLQWVLRTTDFGRQVRAIAQDALAAQLMGINIERVRGIVNGISMAMVAVAGVCAIPTQTLTPYMGLGLTLLAFIITTIGGLGSLSGALIGGLIVGVVQSVGSVTVGGSLSLALVYFVFMIVLVVRPQGILGERVSVIVR